MVAGCTTPNAKLADLPDLRIAVIVDREVDSDNDDTSRPSTVQIGIHYDEARFRAANGDCATIEDADYGSVNGVALGVASQGDRDKEIDECNAPYLRTKTFDLRIGDAGHVEIHDDSLAITAEFPAPTFDPRIAHPVDPANPASRAPWQLVAGQPFAFVWSHPVDLVGVTPDDVSIHFKHGVYYGERLPISEVTDTEIRGVAPAIPEFTGDGVIELLLLNASTADPATSCTGASPCTVTSYRLYDHTAQFLQ